VASNAKHNSDYISAVVPAGLPQLEPFFPCPLRFYRFLLCLAAQADEFVDQVIDRFTLLGLAPHPHERIEKVVEGLSLYFLLFGNFLVILVNSREKLGAFGIKSIALL